MRWVPSLLGSEVPGCERDVRGGPLPGIAGCDDQGWTKAGPTPVGPGIAVPGRVASNDPRNDARTRLPGRLRELDSNLGGCLGGRRGRGDDV